MRSKYDAVVIGAGPSGSMAAFEIASAGFSVLLLEKHAVPGLPLCCAEAVSRPALERLVSTEKAWIAAEINAVRVIAPSGESVTVRHPGAGYILERTIFDPALARRAVAAGGELLCNAIGMELKKENGLFSAVKVALPDNSSSWVEARIFIATDGLESRIAREAGFHNLIPLKDVESLLQYRIDGISIPSDTVEFYVGTAVAPEGYIWVFPKSERAANVGIGIVTGGRRGEKASKLLDDFISERFREGKMTGKYCGLTPKYQGKSMFRMGNLLVAGDASRAIDSLSGAGIICGMLSGRYAGLAAAEYLAGRTKKVDDIETLYPGRFLREKEEELNLYAKLRRVYTHLNDRDFGEIVRALEEYFSRNGTEGVNGGRLLAGIVRARPSLIRLVWHLL
ncbi:putative Digeranylgeranylglycerophospholipid reductase [Candidatus Zixiibacteriota bacterium]|nr:putative Digeranylgeranylglycerophospholipid reductase [candidate division Zixibacteria bacterium]